MSTDTDGERPTCQRDGCDKPVPAPSRKKLNLGRDSGYCNLACMLEGESDDGVDRGEGVETDGGRDVLEHEHEIGTGECHDCDETIGPDLAETVGRWGAYDHPGCDVEIVTWTETEIPTCTSVGCERDATTTIPATPADELPVCGEHA